MRYLLAGALVVVAAGCRPDVAGKESPATGELTKVEADFLRGVCNEGIATTYEGRHYGSFPHREVALNMTVEELHRTKRIAVLRFLLAVAKEGSAKNALTAGVTALALEEGPAYPLPFQDMGSKSFDEKRTGGQPTDRERLAQLLEKALAGAEAGRKLQQDE